MPCFHSPKSKNGQMPLRQKKEIQETENSEEQNSAIYLNKSCAFYFFNHKFARNSHISFKNLHFQTWYLILNSAAADLLSFNPQLLSLVSEQSWSLLPLKIKALPQFFVVWSGLFLFESSKPVIILTSAWFQILWRAQAHSIIVTF